MFKIYNRNCIFSWVILICAILISVKSTIAEDTKTIVVIGDSLAAGYGIDPEDSFPNLIDKKIKTQGLPYLVVNAGLSGETSAGGLRRIDWLLKNRIDILILELGANDALRGLDLNMTEKNLIEIIKKAKSKNPSLISVVAGMKAPPSLGEKYTTQFENLYKNVAKNTDSLLIPFLLEDVAGEEKLNQADGIHPTVDGQKVIAENVWKVLSLILSSSANAPSAGK